MNQTNGLEVALKPERPQPTEKETREIKRLDGIVRKSLAEIKGQDTAFANLGDALRCFRDQKLWRFTHDSFRDYCRDTWKITDRWARKLMVAADVLAGLAESAEGNRGSAQDASANTVVFSPLSAKAAIALAEAPEEKRREIVEAVSAENNGRVTAPAVQEKVARMNHRKGERDMDREEQKDADRVNGKPKRPRKKPAPPKPESKKADALSDFDAWQEKQIPHWQREFGHRAWVAYNDRVFGILREVREWWERRLGA